MARSGDDIFPLNNNFGCGPVRKRKKEPQNSFMLLFVINLSFITSVSNSWCMGALKLVWTCFPVKHAILYFLAAFVIQRPSRS